MNYLRRKIDQYLVEWKNRAHHMPLIVCGARQVGKTESILHFAEANYKNVVYINFAIQPHLVAQGFVCKFQPQYSAKFLKLILNWKGLRFPMKGILSSLTKMQFFDTCTMDIVSGAIISLEKTQSRIVLKNG